MKTSNHGRMAMTVLCAALAACGGSSDAPAALPASVTITHDVRVEAGTAEVFATDIATTSGLTFRWDFGDGSSASGPTASHAYAKSGQYQVTLAVVNSAEDLRTSIASIQVGAYSNVAGFDCTQPDSTGWCWQHAIVTGHQINDVAFVDATHAWAVGDALTILKSSDGGSNWTHVAIDASLAPASLRSVRFYDTMHGMALSDQGNALQTSDGGVTWKLNTLGGSIYVGGVSNFVDYSASRIIVESYYAGNASMSVDGGATWTMIAGSGQLQAVATDCWSVYSTSVVRAAGCGPTGTTPLTISSIANGYQYLQAGSFASSTQGLMVGYGYDYTTGVQVSLAWVTSDSGANWTNFQMNGLPYSLFNGLALRMTDEQNGTLYATGDLTAYSTTNGGHDWTAITSSPTLTQTWSGYRATGFQGSVMWQVSGSSLAISGDRGQTWSTATVHDEDAAYQSGGATSLAVMQYTDANDFVVSAAHRFYVTHDAGKTFTRILGADSRDAGASTAAGFFFDSKHGKFATSHGAILSTADGGRTWTRSDYPVNSGTAIALHFTSATEGWLLLDGKLEHTTDAGATWSMPLTSTAMTGVQGMSWADATHAWAWTYGGLFGTADGGKSWTQLTSPNVNYGVTSAVMTGALTGVANTSYGSYTTTQDGGLTWQAATGAAGYGTLVAGMGQTVWSLAYTPTRSKDGGHTWRAAGPANYGGTITGIAFADDLHGWMITTTGAVLHTIDGGDTWSAQPVGTDLALQAIVAVDSMTAWVITRDGQVLSTATSGN
jgi:photosystem II stability/assembly factor-like uncharacterized protein